MSAQTSNWYARTSQTWKVNVWLAGFALSSAGLLWFFTHLDGAHLSDLQLTALGMGSAALGAFSFLWVSVAVKCPACGARVVWRILRTASISVWFIRVAELTRCPECSYKGSTTKAKGQT